MALDVATRKGTRVSGFLIQFSFDYRNFHLGAFYVSFGNNVQLHPDTHSVFSLRDLQGKIRTFQSSGRPQE